MKILVTGANGYLGRGIIKCLLAHGVDVVAAGFQLDDVDEGAEKKAGDLFAIEENRQKEGLSQFPSRRRGRRIPRRSTNRRRKGTKFLHPGRQSPRQRTGRR